MGSSRLCHQFLAMTLADADLASQAKSSAAVRAALDLRGLAAIPSERSSSASSSGDTALGLSFAGPQSGSRVEPWPKSPRCKALMIRTPVHNVQCQPAATVQGWQARKACEWSSRHAQQWAEGEDTVHRCAQELLA